MNATIEDAEVEVIQDGNTASKRGRKKLVDSVSAENLELAKIEEAREKRIQAVDQNYGEELPYSYERVMGEIRMLGNHLQNAFVETGRKLIMLKEHEGHGNFIKALEELQIPRRTANKFMKCAMVASSLGSNGPTSAHLNQYKLLELAFLEEEELEELGEGGTVANVKLNDIECMSVRQLRETLEKEREERKKKEKDLKDVIKKKNDKINQMELEINSITEEDVAKKRLDDFKREFITSCSSLTSTIFGMEETLNAARETDHASLEMMNKFASQLIDQGTEMVMTVWTRMTDLLALIKDGSHV